ncbi:class II aldolase/adducin N-terminal [Phyllosticta citribraziliensis]|uniref:Class II aldolase/adducin N-terminal n=1 Tax=Phyllosticta citribraziliensis TaxID=989973 RepID=A0ABR1M1A3_9PEZI
MAPPPPPPPSAIQVVDVDGGPTHTTTLQPKNAPKIDQRNDHAQDAPDKDGRDDKSASYQQLNERQSIGVPRPRVFEDKHAERAYLKQRLAAAFRIFGLQGFDEGVAGHITVRDPVNPETFWVNPFGLAFSQITSSSLLHISATGDILPSPSPYQLLNTAAFAIHGAIHRARPDVVAAAHSHSIHGRALCALQVPLDMLTQDSCAFYEDHVVYPNFGGVVMATEEGKRIAERLGQKKCALLGNHGLLTVGGTIEEAVWWFVAMEKCARVQLLADAAAAGRGIQTVKIGDEEARLTWTSIGSRIAGYFSAMPLFDVVEKDEAQEYMDEGKPWVGKAEGL